MSPEESEQARFDAGIRDYLEAFNSGDYKRVASYWTEDAVHLPPMGGEIRGRAALEEFYRQSSETMKAKISDYTCENRFVGDHVIVRESFTVTIQPPGEEPVSMPGKGMWAGRKEPDGVWRTFWALARMDQPALGS
jgi:uncharacterized protein (TIGR02246 family)